VHPLTVAGRVRPVNRSPRAMTLPGRRRLTSEARSKDPTVRQGPIGEALAYKRRVGNKMTWYSTANSPFGADVGAPPGGGFAVNVFLRDGDTVYRTWHTNGRGTEQLTHTFALIDLLPYGRREEWQASPAVWPRSPTYSGWPDSPDIAAAYGGQPAG